jgi:hypothetical protein
MAGLAPSAALPEGPGLLELQELAIEQHKERLAEGKTAEVSGGLEP